MDLEVYVYLLREKNSKEIFKKRFGCQEKVPGPNRFFSCRCHVFYTLSFRSMIWQEIR